MKIIFVNRFFYPDHSATSQILTDLAFFLAGQGFEVEVVTSGQIYDDPGATLSDRERCRGVLVHRVRTSRFGRGSLPGRLLDYLSFYWSAFLRLGRVVRRGDYLVAKTDPPLISVPAAAVAYWRGAFLINWLQDLFPEVAGALGVLDLSGRAGRIALGLRDWSLRRAQFNVAVGERMVGYLEHRGISRRTLRFIPNWSQDRTIRPVEPHRNPLRARWGLGDAFVVGYSGNLGRAHEFETLIGAAALLRGQRGLVFVVIGGGALMEPLRNAVRERGLPNFRFEGYQPRTCLSDSLAVPDVHLVILRPALEGLIVPSKFYGIAAAGRAILHVGDRQGEIARLIRAAEAGRSVAPGDSAILASHILDLRDHRSECRRMGANARRLLDARFSAERSLTAWGSLFSSR